MDSGTLAMIINTIITLLGVFGVSVGIMYKIIKAIKESTDPVAVLHSALQEGSPGGKNLTAEEIDAIIKEINEAKGAWEDVVANRVKG